SAATKHHLVHRDIKPANLMLVREDDDYVVKVIDFGLAKSIKRDDSEDDATLSMGGFVGTAHFASPEQLEEKEIDVRSDIYSLGITLWYMLTGRAPFSGAIAQVMSQHLHKAAPVEQLRHLPAPVKTVVGRMIEKDPALRPQTAGALRLQLEAAIAELHAQPQEFPTLVDDTPPVPTQAVPAVLTQAVPAGPEQAVSAAPKRSPRWVLVGIGVAILLGATGFFFFEFFSKPRITTEQASAPTPVNPTPASLRSDSSPTPSATATPTPIAATPKPTPNEEQALKNGLAQAEDFEAAEDWPAAVSAYVQLHKSFPTSEVGKVRLELLLARLRSNPAALKEAEFEKMRAPLEDATRMDVVSAMEILGFELRKRDPQASFNWLCTAAAHGQPPAMREVGLRYSNGAGVERDFVKASQWFAQAAQQGDLAAKTLLAECYLLGKGVAKNEPKAIALLKDAGGAGDARAMDQLGSCYHKGIGVARDDKEAFRYYTEASRLNYLDSFGNLGVLYLTSDATDLAKDESARAQKAVTLFREGSKQNNPFCMYLYARCLESGTGTEPNATEASTWYRRAAESGNRGAIDWCRGHNVALHSDTDAQ
ncbi:MAG: protein kinase, partial [Verrucomicrobiota bacterium]|nr:protein kinase [Verrucomicrobiota bacterium]